MLEVFKKEHDT